MRLVQLIGVGTTHALPAHQPLLRKDTEGAEFERMGDTCSPGYLTGSRGVAPRETDESAEDCDAAAVAENLVQCSNQAHMVRNLTIW